MPQSAFERGRGVSWQYDCSSETEVPNDQLERLQHGADGARLVAHLVGQRSALASQCKRQAGPAVEQQ